MTRLTRTWKTHWQRYFAAAHLPERRRVAARALMYAFTICAVLMCFVGVFNIVYFGVEGRELKIASHLGSSLILGVIVELTRRGRGVEGTWVFGVATWAMVIQRIVMVGELNAMLCTLLVPIVVFSFMHARRSILVYITSSALIFPALGYWLHLEHVPGSTPYGYTFSSAIFSVIILLLDVVAVTWIVMKIERDTLNTLSQSTHLMEQAQQEAIERSVEAERARQEVQMTQRAKARYLANMSHELRTPLSTIISYSELLDESLEDCSDAPEQSRRDVGLIKGTGEHLLRRINDILDLSRLEAGKMPVQEDTITLKSLFEQADQFAQARAASDQGNRLKVSWPAPHIIEGIEVICDELLTVKLLGHLLLHLKEDGPISVFVKRREGVCELIFKLRFWTIPPAPGDLQHINTSHLHLLLYRELLDTLHLPFHEPEDTTAGARPWSITLNAI